MNEIYRWKNKDDVYEYRFTNGICDGFFSNDKETHQEQKYKGRPMTKQWANNLPVAGFIKV